MPKTTSASAAAVETSPADSPVAVIRGTIPPPETPVCHDPAVKKWAPLAILAAAQFVMVLDQAVMNVSISQLVADFDTSVIAEILQVSVPERNALLDCVEHLQQKARTKVSTNEPEGLRILLDASPQARVPFTLRTLRERAADRQSRATEFFDYNALSAKLSWLVNSEAFDVVNLRSLDPVSMMVPGRVTIIDVSIANDVVKNMVTADMLRKAFAVKVTRPDALPTLLVIEEAHSFISRERVHTMQATLHMLRNVTRRGRKRWLSMAFVSQQPGHLPPEIFELCNTRIVHTLRSTHNLDALIATTGDVGKDLWDRCPLLGPGQAVLSSPQLARSVIVSVRPAACRRRFIV